MKTAAAVFFSLIFFCLCRGNPAGKEVVEYRALVVADKAGVEHFGGEEEYKKKLGILFDNINAFWNKGSDKFEYEFKFVPVFGGTYGGSSAGQENRYRKDFDLSKADFLLVLDHMKDHGDEGEAYYCGEDSNGIAAAVIRFGTDEPKDCFSDESYRSIAHEFGHYRLVTDLYASGVYAKNNPVNGEDFSPAPCIMLSASHYDKWCAYAAAIINHVAKSKVPHHDFPKLFQTMFPKYLAIHVTRGGKPVEGAKVSLYGVRGAKFDVVAPAYRVYETGKDGRVLIGGAKEIYCNPPQPNRPEDLPWGRWFNFLVEAEYNGEKAYGWMPEYEVQMPFFDGKDIYETTISL